MCSVRRNIALVTGATSGIGEAFAGALAERGFDLVIAGRREKELAGVADGIKNKTGVDVEVGFGDLSDESHLESLVRRVKAMKNLEVLVNNAGFGTSGGFMDLKESIHRAMMAVHATATMRLTYAALPGMIARKAGTVINVSSIGGFFPFPGNAMYGGTKAFVRYFTESLHLDLLGTGVRVQALCPGMTRTDFHSTIGLNPQEFYRSGGVMKAMTAQEVVKVSLKYLEKNDPVCVPGINNRFTFLLCRFLPRKLLYRIALSTMEEWKDR